MGFFSWRTQDTNKSIPNHYQDIMPTFLVWMHDNTGRKWCEPKYDGYGEFGGKDYYELLAEMNDLESSRDAGLSLAFSGKGYIAPNLTESEKWTWVDEEPVSCKYQGYFYYQPDDDYDFDDVYITDEY